ncbi:MAG TPA: trigger factor [Actinomycetaceae bacterium]|nr:trigger factor [Actinomycetaceae bacterium]
MKSAVEILETTRVKITVETPYDELKSGIDAAYRDIANQINVPGFRKGKVPARIIDQRVGRATVIEQALNEALPGLYRDAVADTGIKALGQPEISITEIPNVEGPLGGQLTFIAEVEVRPEMRIPPMSSIAIEVDSTEVTDDAVEERLTALRERFGTLVVVDRPIEDGDFVVIDLTATIDGEEVESVSGISYQVGSGSMIDGLDEALTGTAANEEQVFKASLAGGEHEGDDADVTVVATEVKERELPEADDEFAQLASEFDTIDELREDLRGAVARDAAQNQAMQAQGKLMEHLRENVEFPLPQGIIDAEVAAHLQREGKAADDPHGDEVRESTRAMLRDQLLLDVITEQYAVQVGQDELLQFLFQTAQQYGMDPSEFIQSADQNGQIPVFLAEIARNKAVAIALRHVKVSDPSGAEIDLSEYIGTDTEEEAALAARLEEDARNAPEPMRKTAGKDKPDEAGDVQGEESGEAEGIVE